MDSADIPDAAAQNYCRIRRSHWERIARGEIGGHSLGGFYHRSLISLYRFHIPKDSRVLEIGCGKGDLLAALEPAEGVGVDFSPAMIRCARERYPHLRFIEADAHVLTLTGQFDVIVLSDLVNDVWDVQKVFSQLIPYVTPRTRVFINFHSHLWSHPLKIAQQLGLMTPLLPQNWLTVDDIANLLDLSGFEVIRHSDEVLLPLPLWPLTSLCNRWLARLWPFRYASLTHFMSARLRPGITGQQQTPSVSVVVAARNEEGNIPAIFARVPPMGSGTELIIVEGHSQDDTWGAIQRELPLHPGLRPRALRQPGKGKGDAVRTGFAEASGDILMILDADMTVQPEDLPRFYDAIASGRGEFINGVRLVYPMQEGAMRFLNLLGNKFFSLAFSWLLGQPIKDTLCGTKVLWKSDYDRIAANRSYFGEFDPFGDFDLLFGAAKLDLKHVEMPIRYGERTYGTTNIQRFRHGMLLFRMVLFAARKIKFV